MYENLIILLIDDDKEDKDMFCEVVSEINKNIRCIWAPNGLEGFNTLESQSPLPDFIFLDLNMPRMNGKQCLEKIKQTPKFSSIPVIIYSTSKLVEDKEETERLGSAYFLTKPSSMKELKKELENILTNKYESVKKA